jgi:hypothetical protein
MSLGSPGSLSRLAVAEARWDKIANDVVRNWVIMDEA